FTRRVNLKGHLRAHNDERPFACGWDGCDRAFARLHDRKRHEQLHNVYRPFACEGCGEAVCEIGCAESAFTHQRRRGLPPSHGPGAEARRGG
ncbi:hypothetical protein C8R47DRAFT_1027137, partial [Mycena vitilis]